MTDDLVKRLRAVGGLRHDGATRWYVNPDGPEAADRIEFLEKALQSILKVPNSEAAYGIIRVFAHNALEKKDGKEDRG